MRDPRAQLAMHAGVASGGQIEQVPDVISMLRGAPIVFVALFATVALGACSADEDKKPVAPDASISAASSTSAAPAAPSTSAPPTASSTAAPAAAADVTAVVSEICAKAPCVQTGTLVAVWRDEAGAARFFRVDGSITRCSHPPSSIYDAAVIPVMAIANRPVTPDVAADLQRQVAELTRGTTARETIACP